MVKIEFKDFWKEFNPKKDKIFGELLQEYFDIKYVDKNPDIVIFSVFGDSHKKFNNKNKIKVFYSGENFNAHRYKALDKELGWEKVKKYSDYCITSFKNYSWNNHFRLPDYIRKYGFDIKDKIEKINSDIDKKEGIVYMQSNCKKFRNDFVKNLMKKKHVDCVGRCLKNKKVNVKNKLNFISSYKMNVSFENSRGYTTEKLIDSFMADVIPIYYGEPDIGHDYNEKALINYHQFKTENDFIDYIIETIDDDDKVHNMIEQPKIINKDLFDKDKFIKFFSNIINKSK